MVRAYFFLYLVLAVSMAKAVDASERILTTNEAPTNYLENNVITGTTTEIVREILRLLGRETEIELMPWVRVMSLMERGEDVIAFTAGKSPERIEHGYHFLGPVSTRKHILWKRKGSNITIASEDEIVSKKLTIGAMKADWRSSYFKDMGAIVDETTSHVQSLRKLHRQRIDLWASSDLEVQSVSELAGLDVDALEIAYVFKEAPSYIMFSKKSSIQLRNEWRIAFSELQNSGFLKELAVKWSHKLNISFSYSAENGFFVTTSQN